jgi:hypothetical protein
VSVWGYFAVEAYTGPLRTTPESEPGHGGCPAINGRYRNAWYRRWRIAAGRSVEREFARKRRGW